jgi:hypothetical protein
VTPFGHDLADNIHFAEWIFCSFHPESEKTPVPPRERREESESGHRGLLKSIILKSIIGD